MKEMVVISGKGGTGKTSLVGSLAVLATNKVLADCDVDAANLHLLVDPVLGEEIPFHGLKKAAINESKCIHCKRCSELCRFDAIRDNSVNVMFCEGCGLCSHVCPAGAVEMREHRAGTVYKADTRYGPFVYAQLGAGEENSGKLVAAVRREARRMAEENGCQLLLTDGPPGIGCPVISCLTGADLALVVTEPTVSGIHDLIRVLDLLEHFGVSPAVCINKWDICREQSDRIENVCRQRKVPLPGRIPYDKFVNISLREGRPLLQYTDSGAADDILALWDRLHEMLYKGERDSPG